MTVPEVVLELRASKSLGNSMVQNCKNLLRCLAQPGTEVDALKLDPKSFAHLLFKFSFISCTRPSLLVRFRTKWPRPFKAMGLCIIASGADDQVVRGLLVSCCFLETGAACQREKAYPCCDQREWQIVVWNV